MKRSLFPLLVLLFSLQIPAMRALAQFETVDIGVNGLTCSQCTRTVEMSLRKLPFVANVNMNLEHTRGTITIKAGSHPDMDKVAQAVIDAGFSVRSLTAALQINSEVISKGRCMNYGGDQYILTDAPQLPVKGIVNLQFIGKKYLPKKEYRKMEHLMTTNSCGGGSGKTYHVAVRA